MKFIEALVDVGQQQKDTWAIRAEDVLLTCRDEGNGLYYQATLLDKLIATSEIDTVGSLDHDLISALNWLVEQGRREVVLGDEWEFADPDELM